MPFNYDHHCFACGDRNSEGLKLKFVQEGKIISTVFTPSEIYQGYPGLLHGGIVSTLFDEVMSQCLWVLGQVAFTARLEVRFRQNIPIQKPIKFEAWIVKQKGRLVELEARAVRENGDVAAEAKGRFMKVIHRNAQPFFGAGNKEIMCLLIHGFTGSPADIKPLGDYLQAKGFGVTGLLLPGHGTTPQSLAKTRWPQWFKAVEDEYLRLRKKYKTVIPIGLSMGAILAFHLSAKYEVKGLVSFSAPIFFINEQVYQASETDLEYFSKKRTSEEKMRNLMEGRFSYEEIPMRALASLLEVIDLVKEELEKIKVPTLLIQSQDDSLVKPQSAQYLYDHLGSTHKKLVWFEKSGHVITLGGERQQVYEAVEGFLGNYV